MITLLVLAHPTDPELALLERLPDDVRVVAGDRIEAFQSAARDADAVLLWWGDPNLLQQVLDCAPRVRWVHSASAGVDTLLVPALVNGPAFLTNARGAYSPALGEFAAAAMLFFAKDLRRMLRNQAAQRWDEFDVDVLAGHTLGIIGYGDIGHAIAARARPFGMRVLALRRHPERCREDPLVDAAYPFQQRVEMIRECDYVACAAPLTPETHGLIGEAELAAMKPEAVLINVGRGPVISEPALIRALEGRRIRGAALDVFETEPLPDGHPFWRLDNVLLSPHCADHTPGWRARSMELFLANFERFRAGKPLENVVDKQRGY